MRIATRWAIVLLLPALLSACVTLAKETLPPPGLHIFKWTPEQQQTGYKNVEKLWPSRVVRTGPSVHPLPAADQEIDPRMQFDGQSYDTAGFMAANRVSGLLVIKDGKVALERYGLGRRPDERWISFSVTKSITSTLVGAAIQDGHIKSLDDRVTRYIPELKGSAYDRVTVRQLLTMRSGVQWNENYEDPNSDVGRAGSDLPYGALNPIVRYMKGLPRAAAPGTAFLYNTAETDLAGILVSAAVGKPLSVYLSEKIWAGFGMEHEAFWPTDTGGHERGGCCLAMTLRDYGRFGQFVLADGKIGDRRVLPAGWIEDATRAHVTDPSYGYFWWVRPPGFGARGIYGQSITIIPEERLVVAINSAWPTARNDEYGARQASFLQAIRKAF